MIEYRHIASRLFNRPLLIERAAADTIASFMLARMSDLRAGKTDAIDSDAGATRHYFSPKELPGGDAEVHSPRTSRFYGDFVIGADGKPLPFRRTADGDAIITLVGEWVNRGAWVGASSGLLSYEGFTHQMRRAAADPQTARIILDLESPGGEAVGAFEAAAVVREAAKVKPVIAVVNGMAASAAYAIASGARKIVTIPTGMVGSIGVVLLHIDFSQWLADEGIKPTLIFAGDHKVDGNPYQPLPPAVRKDLQAEINQFYDRFIGTVTKGRRMTADAVRATQARVFMGQDAVDAGLADAVGTIEDVLFNRQSITKQGPIVMTDKADTPAATAAPTETAAATPTAQPEAKPAAQSAPAAQPAAPAADAVAAERARVDEIHRLSARHKMPDGFAAKHIDAGSSLAAVREQVLSHVASEADKTAISARTPAPGTDRQALSASWERAFKNAGATV